MSDDENMAAVRRFFDLVNDGNLDAIGGLIAPGFQLHFDGMPVFDEQGATEFFRGFVAAFPGIHHEILDQFAADDRVATRILVTGVQSGDFMGMPATGRQISIGGINIHRFADGHIAEQWVNSDSLGMLQQLGMIPSHATVET
jgi:steroid delta-isomerase-like uncharacterized protein